MRARADIRDYMSLAESEAALIGRAEQFAEEVVRPSARHWQERRQPGLLREVVEAWAATGLVALQVPREHGGLAGSFRCKIGMAEVLARPCFGSSFALINLQNGPARIARDGEPGRIARYLDGLKQARLVMAPALSEPGAGSDFAAIATTARRTSGGYLLDGEKAWLTNGAIADLAYVYAQSEPGSRGRGIGCFLVHVKRPGAQITAPYELEAGSIMGVAGLKLAGYRVEDADVIYPPGKAFASALASLNAARAYVAAMCLGMVGEALDVALRYGRERTTFGQPLVEHQGWRWQLADVATELEAARLMTYRAATLIDEGGDAVMAAAMAKKYAVEMAGRALPACLQAMGAVGLKSDHAVSRHILSARIAGFVDGSSEIQTDRIGRILAEAG
jgi:alkylation response protein AidB-like acyl-CoA dehydrogenase